MLQSRFPTLLCVAAASLYQVGCAAHRGPLPEEAPGPKADLIRLTIVGTNDLHGWVAGRSFKLADGTVIEEGGLPAFAGYLSILRSDNPGGTLLLDAGDLFLGTLAADLTEGAVVIDAYNYLGYQAAAIGNHEFDYGPEGPASTALQPEQDPFGALKARLGQAKFPMLAVNIYNGETGDRPDWLSNDGTVLLDVKGVKVGLLGLITPATPNATNPVNVASLRFGSLLPEVLSAAGSLRERGAEVVIALVHAGGKCTRHDNPRDLSSCDTDSGEIFELLQALPANTLDAVVAGHTHQVVGHFVNGTPVIETWGLGRWFGLIELYFEPIQRTVIPALTTIQPAIPICLQSEVRTGACSPQLLETMADPKMVPTTFRGRPVVRDPKLDELLAPALAQAESAQTKSLGLKVLDRLARDRDGEGALGDLLTDSLREMERADIALLNPGGLRADIEPGELTYGKVYETLPFNDQIASVELTGDELLRLLRVAYGGRRGVFPVSGLKIQLSQCPGPNRLRRATLADGALIFPQAIYRIVMPDFLARGGDGLGVALGSVPPARIKLHSKEGHTLRDGLIAFWQKRNRDLRAPPADRISFSADAVSCAEAVSSSNVRSDR
jgi:5'-nucleotidase